MISSQSRGSMRKVSITKKFRPCKDFLPFRWRNENRSLKCMQMCQAATVVFKRCRASLSEHQIEVCIPWYRKSHLKTPKSTVTLPQQCRFSSPKDIIVLYPSRILRYPSPIPLLDVGWGAVGASDNSPGIVDQWEGGTVHTPSLRILKRLKMWVADLFVDNISALIFLHACSCF